MSELHALLVGIDHYEPDRFADGLPILQLGGCVRDVERMESFLRDQPLAVPAGRIRKLVSPLPAPGRPRLAPEDLPTYQNLIAEVEALAERTRRGDRLVIHYSGHGASLPTAVPAKKGTTGRDEALVPCDGAAPREEGGGFLRDVELHALLLRLAARGLRVTLILDCCHSGGATRTLAQGRVRGLGHLPMPAGAPGPLGSWDALGDLLPGRREMPEPGTFRHLPGAAGWFPQPDGCVLLAACLPTEYALEYPFDGEGCSGALTHVLLESMGDLDPRTTCRRLHRRLLKRIRGLVERQTPVLEGDGEGVFLGVDRWPVAPLPPSELRPPSGVAQPGPGPRCYRVGTVPRDDRGRALRRTLERMLEAWVSTSAPRLAVAEEEAEADFLVDVTGRGAYRILERSGEPLPWQGEAIAAGEPGAAERLVSRLQHVARYRAVADLEGATPGSALSGRLRAELFALERMEDWRDPTARVPVAGGSVPSGTLLCLLVHNDADRDLNLVVLDLQPDWGIRRAHPNRHEGDFATLHAAAELPIFLRAYLPDRMDRGRDLLKLIAATGPLDTGHLECGALGESIGYRKLQRSPGRTLRTVEPVGLPIHGWTAETVEVIVERRDGQLPDRAEISNPLDSPCPKPD